MVQIISPHIDDAFLSLGGMIVEWSKLREPIDISYVFSVSNWTSPNAVSMLAYPTDKQKVTAIRKSEEMDVNNLVPCTYRFLDFPDAAVRAREGTVTDEDLLPQIRKKLETIIDPEAQCFFPLGLGHPDHLMIRDIGMNLLLDHYNIWFYEDMPYMAYQELLPDVMYNMIAGLGLTPVITPINFHRKLDVLKCYRSQLSAAWLQAITNFSYGVSDNNFYERCWHLPVHNPNLAAMLTTALERIGFPSNKS